MDEKNNTYIAVMIAFQSGGTDYFILDIDNIANAVFIEALENLEVFDDDQLHTMSFHRERIPFGDTPGHTVFLNRNHVMAITVDWSPDIAQIVKDYYKQQASKNIPGAQVH